MQTQSATGVLVLVFLLGAAVCAQATVIDFTGGTAYLDNGTSGVTSNTALFQDVVDYYIEDGFRYDFIGINGTVGDYYSIGVAGRVGNDVIHAHWSRATQMVITKVDGKAFDLNYIDLTSNTIEGGGQATGSELSYITNDTGYSMLLPSSDWGFDSDYYGNPGDGVARLWLDDNFDDVVSVTFTSQNAFCFGLDNFYIDEPPPPQQAAEPAAILLLGGGLIALATLRKQFK